MHVTTKETDASGKHILTSVIEGDGAVELASEKAEFSAEIVSVQRTSSGGVQVQLALEIKEPAPVATPGPATPKDQAIAYFVAKGFTPDAAAKQVEKFGVARVIGQANKEADEASKKLDDELADLVSVDAPKA